ncbi:MAG: hypothetical protein A2Z12_01440 [Actinobacteria bacterium RBG_16_68_21]|nr:MAG: hypothetical protein A2Z12_01440 [Actinobacteria bacterium RBG_16_68_21]
MHRPVRALVLVPLLLAVTACGGNPAPPTLADELAEYAGTVTTAITGLQDALDRRYDTLPQLYVQIIDMRLPVTVAVALDKAARVPTTTESRAALDRYLEYGDEVLAALADLDAAIAAQQVEAASMAASRIDAAAGLVAIDLGADLCVLAAPPSVHDLCHRPTPTDQYESDLQAAVLGFVAEYRPLLRLPAAFGDVVRGAVLTEVAPQVVELLDTVAAQIDDLTPDQPHMVMQQALVDFVGDTRARWAAVDPDQVDLLMAQFLLADLRDVTCDHLEPLNAARSLLLGAVPDSAIPATLAIFFDDPDTGCVDR